MLRSRIVTNIVVGFTLVVVAIIMAFPFYWSVTTAFKQDADIHSPHVVWLPTRFTTEHFFNVFFPAKSRMSAQIADNFLVATRNSVLYVIISVSCSLLFCSMAAYVLAKKRFKHDNVVLFIIVATMMIPDPMAIIPNFTLVNRLGWVNTFAGLLAPGMISAFATFFLRQSMLAIPDELIDSAKIDGAGDLRIFWWLILPLSRPVLAALAIVMATSRWNELIWPLIVTNKPSMIMLSIAQAHLHRVIFQPGDLMAGVTYAAVPLMVIYFLFSRQFIAGLTSGALKY